MRWVGRRRDEAGTAMVLVVMCLLVTMMLSTALLGVVVGEARPTANQAKSIRTQAAAEAGLAAATGLLRAATAGALVGDLAKLPCLSSLAPLTGTVSASGSGGSTVGYSVTVSYFTIDPQQQSAAWRVSNALSCVAGIGPASPPAFALVAASATGTTGTGADTALGNRSLELVYSFRTSDAATAGGQIPSFATFSPTLCWTAPSGSPAAGAGLTLGACTNSSAQLFSYRSDYSIALSGTQAPDATGGMCVTSTLPSTTTWTDDLGTRADALAGYGAPTSTGTGPFAGTTAAVLNGTSQYLRGQQQVAAPGPAAVTVTARFKTTTGGVILQYRNPSPESYDRHLWIDPAGRLVWGAGYGEVVSTTGHADNQWHTAVASIGPAGLNLWVDGTFQGTNTSYTTAQPFPGYWTIGWGNPTGWINPPSTGYFTGALAHVAVYPTQLTTAQTLTLSTPTTDATERATVLGLRPADYWPLAAATTTAAITFQPCDDSPAQQWGYDGKTFVATQANGSALSNQCVTATNMTVSGSPLSYTTCGGSHFFQPDASVGTGRAGGATGQWVNYAEFSRCIDVPGFDVNAGYVWDWPCKQDPTGSVAWNQRWAWDAAVTHQLQTNNGSAYCLTAPTTAGSYPSTVPCAAVSAQRWTVNGDTGNRTTSYTIVAENTGMCLDLASTQLWGLATPLVVNPCQGTYSQKWNAPPQLEGGGVASQRETTTG